MKIQNPHDKFFKETFGNIAVAKDFINNYVPENIINIIDINTLEAQKDSFINEELQEEFSDLLFRVNINNEEGYIYFLFEHKSYTSKNTAFQLYKYMINIWEAKIKKERIDKLPIIIPLVIYHGKDKWNIKTSLGEMINGYSELPEDIKKYIPNFEYLLYDISRYTDEEIRGEAINRIGMTILRDVQIKEGTELFNSIYKAAIYLRELIDKQTGIEYFETIIRYIFSAKTDMTKDDVNEIYKKIETVYPEGSEDIMTLAERFREQGKEEGIIKGMEKGETKALARTTIKFLTRKFGSLPENIRKSILNLDAETLDVILDSIFEIDSLDDIKKYIQ